MSSFEDEYLDVLQNIEFAIVQVAHQHPELTDYEVEKALNALMHMYKRPNQEGGARLQAGSLAEEVYEAVKAMCDWRLGSDLQTPEGLPANLPDGPPLTIDEIQACLKRIRKSLQTWNKRGGRRGYLEFIDQFVG
jgi:hypothetical protein